MSPRNVQVHADAHWVCCVIATPEIASRARPDLELEGGVT